MPMQLNEKQTIAFTLMKEGKNVFITGPGGVGKTALIKKFKNDQSKYINIAITSTTGTSALLLNGTTLHSFLGIKTGSGSIESMVMDIQKKSHARKKWKTVDCLIIDEISMLDPDLFDKLEHMARIIRKNTKPFGGIQLVVSGDFLQLPCVGTNNFCFQAESWDRCIVNTIYLTDIIRQSETDFQICLNSIRLGTITPNVKDTLLSRMGAVCTNKYNIIPTKLYSSNYEVEHINNIELDNLSRDGRQFYEYTMNIQSNSSFATERIKKNCNAQEEVQVCVDAQVMLLKNIDIDSGLVNGSRGIITEFIEDLPLVRFLNGVERIIDISTWDILDNDNKCISTITQIPLKVAYAISIHKSQGCSLDCVEIDLGNIFEYGQAYVALSRVKSLQGLSIVNINFDKINAHPIAVEYYNSLLENTLVTESNTSSSPPTQEDPVSYMSYYAIDKKTPSHMISCELFKQGLSVDAIADKRNLVCTTIMDHLCKSVSEGIDIDLTSFVTDTVISRVKQAYNHCDQPTTLKPIFEFLKKTISYNEIRISLSLLKMNTLVTESNTSSPPTHENPVSYMSTYAITERIKEFGASVTLISESVNNMSTFMLSIEDHQVCLSPVSKIGGLMEGKVRIVIEGPKAAIINPVSGKKTMYAMSIDNALQKVKLFIQDPTSIL